MPKQIISLKIDFKFDDRDILRIIDLGDGFGADDSGFTELRVDSKMLSDIHDTTGASIASLFGELPFHALQPESIHIPLVLRQPVSARGSYDTHDLPSHSNILPYCQQGRLASYVSHIWGMQKPKTLVAPAGLIAAEMHKALWYFLMHKHIPLDKQSKVLYWCNDVNPAEINLNDCDMRQGVFIKIGDRSTGGATDEVFYASDKKEIFKITAALHEQYIKSNDQFKKHFFLIEPAYTTIKPYQNENYNVTGRAFLTIIHDQEQQSFVIKIAAAKWMFPLEAIKQRHTSKQMLSNVKNNIIMQSLTDAELEKLSTEIHQTYRKTFEAAFENIDLLTYFADHPEVNNFLACVRPNSSYGLFLKTYYSSDEYNSKIGLDLMEQSMASMICRDSLNDFNRILTLDLQRGLFTLKSKLSLDKVLRAICIFSLFERYIAHLKGVTSPLLVVLPQLSKLKDDEPLIKSKLNALILQYLKETNESYDTQDLSRALRQAACFGDVVVLKILIYTHRVKVNTLSPTDKTALDYARTCKNKELKIQVLKLLDHVNAKTGQQVLAEPAEEKKPAMQGLR